MESTFRKSLKRPHLYTYYINTYKNRIAFETGVDFNVFLFPHLVLLVGPEMLLSNFIHASRVFPLPLMLR